MPIREEAINVFMGLPGDGDRLELTYNFGVDAYELGTGYNHIALTVDDLDGDARARWPRRGSSPRSRPTGSARAARASASCATRTATGSSSSSAPEPRAARRRPRPGRSLDLARGEPQRADAGGGEHRVARPVALERPARAVERRSRRPRRRARGSSQAKSDLEAERAAVDHGARDAGAVAEAEERLLELAAGERRARRGARPAASREQRRPRPAGDARRATARSSVASNEARAPPPGRARARPMRRGSVAARSSSVRAGVVTGTPSCSVTSPAPRAAWRWTRMPGRRRWPLRGTVTSIRVAAEGRSPQCAAADAWLSTAPSPHASTAASRCASRRSRRCPSA